MTDSAHNLLGGLRLERAASDTVRARVLSALLEYANDVNDESLAAEAKALMPKANPFRPPPEWKKEYQGGLRSVADVDCGVDVDADEERYAGEFWEMCLTDEQRALRLENPQLGWQDGETDGEKLNDA